MVASPILLLTSSLFFGLGMFTVDIWYVPRYAHSCSSAPAPEADCQDDKAETTMKRMNEKDGKQNEPPTGPGKRSRRNNSPTKRPSVSSSSAAWVEGLPSLHRYAEVPSFLSGPCPLPAARAAAHR